MVDEIKSENSNLEIIVREIIAEALSRNISEIQLISNLINDLGAESLDFLDIVFKLEQRFNIQITRGEMERAARGDMAEDEFAPGGVISDEGLKRLRALMPEVESRIKPGLRPVEILGLFSVQTFINVVKNKSQEFK